MISKSGVHLPDTTYGGNPIAWKNADDSDEELRRLRAENANLRKYIERKQDLQHFARLVDENAKVGREAGCSRKANAQAWDRGNRVTNEELYHRVTSEMFFNRAVMSAMAALVLFAVIGERRDVMLYLMLYAAYCLVRSLEEWVRGSDE